MFSGNIFVQIWYKFICNLNKDLCYLSEICGSLFLVVFESPATFLVGIWESVSDSQMGFSSSDLIERQAGSVWVEGDEEETPAWWESGDLLSGRGPGNLTSKSEHRRDLTVVSLHSHLYERRRKNSFLCQMKHDMDIWGKVMWPVEPGVTCICRLKCKLSGFLISMLKVL